MKVFVVLSGKGGVGKTTVSASLVKALAAKGRKMGVVDCDIHGPNMHLALKMEKGNPTVDLTTRTIIPMEHDGIKVWSLVHYVPKNAPILWDGPRKAEAVGQFLTNIDWGDAEYLIADLPPGCGEEVATALEKLKPAGAILVTTPSDMALEDYFRVRTMVEEFKVPLLYTIMNMSVYRCPKCKTTVHVFGKPGAVDGKVLTVPLDPAFAESKYIPQIEKVARELVA